MNRDAFQKTFLILLVIGISILFYFMIKSFVVTLLLAAIFAGILNKLVYEKLLALFRERRALAAICTLLIFVLVIVVPLTLFVGILANQAISISKSAAPWIEEQINHPDELYEKLRNLPGFEYVEPYRDDILMRLASIAGNIGNFVARGLSAATTGTVAFFFQFFVFLYAMFFFLIDGEAALRKILYYMPLSSKDEARMMDKFVSVSGATIKGTLLIGVIQGGMAGVGLWVAGVGGAVFWGTMMVVLSIIPGIGTALVWVPAVIYLAAVGKTTNAVGLALYCGLIVGSVDNILRPRLVGRDVKMNDLMILISTLGGIFLFGAVGFILGPIIAALFLTVWEIYGKAFNYALAEKPTFTRRRRSKPRNKPDKPPRGEPSPRR
jgi:predicted PurR-regulated permease PerM